jgi:hypothetical protein
MGHAVMIHAICHGLGWDKEYVPTEFYSVNIEFEIVDGLLRMTGLPET